MMALPVEWFVVTAAPWPAAAGAHGAAHMHVRVRECEPTHPQVTFGLFHFICTAIIRAACCAVCARMPTARAVLARSRQLQGLPRSRLV